MRNWIGTITLEVTESLVWRGDAQVNRLSMYLLHNKT